MFSHKHYLRFARFVCTTALLFAISSIANIFNTANTSAATYEASISTSGSITLDVSPAGNGASVTTDTLNIVSTCPEGYEVLIQGPADTTLYKDGNKSNTAATKKINASAGTKDTPRGIIGTDTTSGTSNMNTWGYSIGDPATGNTLTPATIHSTSFIGLNNSLTSLYTKNSGTTATGDNLPVYYGVSVDTSIETGSYTMAETTTGANDNKIVYSLVTNPDCMTYQVIFNPTSTAGGQTVSGTGTMPNQRIKEGIATPLTTNAFTAPEGYTFVGWNTAQDGSGTSYTNGQSVTDIANPGETLTLYAQWTDCPAYKICYKDNGANSPTKMDNQSIGGDSTTLWASNFQYRDATKPDTVTVKGFAGWNTKADGTGTSYGPNETITLTTGQYNNGGLKLYAMWVDSAGSLQDWNGCSSLNTGDVTALTDQRDGNTYAVAKLADGKCWMIENLRLDNTNTDNATGALAQGYNSSFIGLADPETANFNNDGVANSLYSTDGSTSAPAITGINTGYRFPRFNNQNTASSTTNMTGTRNNTYSYGNYYTWPAAVADTSYYYIDNQSITTTSICPKGWRLPQGGDKTRVEQEDDNDFWTLAAVKLNNGVLPNNYSSSTYPFYTGNEATGLSNALRSFPNNFIYSGGFSDSSAIARGSSGVYWSSTTFGGRFAHGLDFNSSGVFPGAGGSAGNKGSSGSSVRCLVGS